MLAGDLVVVLSVELGVVVVLVVFGVLIDSCCARIAADDIGVAAELSLRPEILPAELRVGLGCGRVPCESHVFAVVDDFCAACCCA